MKKETKQSNDFKVYMHINKINNKKYIGVTSLELHRRWGYNGEGYLHKNKDGEYTQPLMARAILKYGWDGFDHEVIAEGLTEEEANKLEKSLIDEYKTNDPNFGYNIREGGGASGHLSDETKKKLSKSLTGKFVGDKNPMYGRSGPLSPAWGKKHTKEELQAMSERMKGEKNPMYGKKYTEEERQRIGEISKGKPRSEETKQKISQKNKEYYQTHAHHMTGTHRSDEFKKMMSKKMKGRLFSENTRKKMSENHHDV